MGRWVRMKEEEAWAGAGNRGPADAGEGLGAKRLPPPVGMGTPPLRAPSSTEMRAR